MADVNSRLLVWVTHNSTWFQKPGNEAKTAFASGIFAEMLAEDATMPDTSIRLLDERLKAQYPDHAALAEIPDWLGADAAALLPEPRPRVTVSKADDNHRVVDVTDFLPDGTVQMYTQDDTGSGRHRLVRLKFDGKVWANVAPTFAPEW